jgi:aspartate-semialdehyde dehydrogenase
MLSVAVVGPKGLVGSEIVELLDTRQFPVTGLRLLGSLRTAGAPVEHAGREESIALLGPQSFDGVELAFFAAGPRVSGEFAPAAVAAGAAVVDVSSRFRLDPDVPLVVPEVNAPALGERRERGIVASPSGTVVALSVVLGPLAAAAGLARVVVSTYQGAASGGRQLLNQLSRDTIALLNARGGSRGAASLAFDCLPQIGAVEPGGATTHELHVVEETRKVLGDPGLAMSVTAVRVPVFFGQGMAVTLETEQPLDAVAAADLLRDAPGLVVHDEAPAPYATLTQATGTDAIHVGRIRVDPAAERTLALWVSVDSVRKGAALNAVEIAEILTRDYL